MQFSRRTWLLWLLVLLPYAGAIMLYVNFKMEIGQIQSSNFILIDKNDYSLKVYDYQGRMLEKYGIALGKLAGNKRSKGDMRTPEGVFKIESVENADSWTHDFKNDTIGEVKGAYGPYFIRLKVPGQRGIGIHGTHEPNSIGKRVSEGCIRMRNEDIKSLVRKIHSSSVVVIVPGRIDVSQNNIDEDLTMANRVSHDSINGTKKAVELQNSRILRKKMPDRNKNGK